MPAAAVIPAPIAYIKVVAVKKFVVEFLDATAVRLRVCTCCSGPNLAEKACGLNWLCVRIRINYCEQIRVFKAGISLEYISME